MIAPSNRLSIPANHKKHTKEDLYCPTCNIVQTHRFALMDFLHKKLIPLNNRRVKNGQCISCARKAASKSNEDNLSIDQRSISAEYTMYLNTSEQFISQDEYSVSIAYSLRENKDIDDRSVWSYNTFGITSDARLDDYIYNNESSRSVLTRNTSDLLKIMDDLPLPCIEQSQSLDSTSSKDLETYLFDDEDLSDLKQKSRNISSSQKQYVCSNSMIKSHSLDYSSSKSSEHFWFDEEDTSDINQKSHQAILKQHQDGSESISHSVHTSLQKTDNQSSNAPLSAKPSSKKRIKFVNNSKVESPLNPNQIFVKSIRNLHSDDEVEGKPPPQQKQISLSSRMAVRDSIKKIIKSDVACYGRPKYQENNFATLVSYSNNHNVNNEAIKMIEESLDIGKVSKLMVENINSPIVVEVALERIRLVLNSFDKHSLTFSPSVYALVAEEISSSMVYNKNVTRVVEKACNTIQYLCTHEHSIQWKEAFGKHLCLSSLFTCLEEQLNHDFVVITAFDALWHITYENKSAISTISKRHCIFLFLKVLRKQRHSQVVVDKVFRVFSIVPISTYLTGEVSLNVADKKFICQMLQEHIRSMSTVESILNVILNNTSDNIEFVDDIFVDTLIEASQEHVMSFKIQKFICKLLQLLISSSDRMKNLVVEKRGIEALCDIINRNYAPDIRGDACACLRFLSKSDNFVIKTRLAKSAVIDTIMKCVDEHPNDTCIQNNALSTVESLCGYVEFEIEVDRY